MSYQEDIDNAIKSKIISENDIYDFRQTPMETLLSNFYGFCREHLNLYSKRLNISPSILIFTNSFNSNAMAKRENNVFSIHINLGLFQFCDKYLLNNKRLDTYFQARFSNYIGNFDIPISKLAFQIATQFTYYHEFAHLMQFSKKGNPNTSLQEKYDMKSEYSRKKHLLEINADAFASLLFAEHIHQYIKRSFGDNITESNIKFTIVALCTCLLNHIANFCEDLTELYYNEFKHPHPLMRISLITLNIVNSFNQMTFYKEKRIEIKINETANNIFKFYEELEREGIFKTKFGKALDIASQQQNRIIKFMVELIDFTLDDYNNAIEVWKNN